MYMLHCVTSLAPMPLGGCARSLHASGASKDPRPLSWVGPVDAAPAVHNSGPAKHIQNNAYENGFLPDKQRHIVIERIINCLSLT